MSGTTYLKVAEAAKVLGFESVEEMFPDYDINTTELFPDGKVVMGKNVVLGDLLIPEEEDYRCNHPDHQRPIISPMIYPMTTPSPTTWPGGTFTVTNTANATDEQRTAFATIMTAGK
jgi:hypothetical protein